MEIGDKVTYRESKNSRRIYFGTILGFKEDKIKVSKYWFCDFSEFKTENYIDKEDII
jgi:hypothetical protein